MEINETITSNAVAWIPEMFLCDHMVNDLFIDTFKVFTQLPLIFVTLESYIIGVIFLFHALCKEP